MKNLFSETLYELYEKHGKTRADVGGVILINEEPTPMTWDEYETYATITNYEPESGESIDCMICIYGADNRWCMYTLKGKSNWKYKGEEAMEEE